MKEKEGLSGYSVLGLRQSQKETELPENNSIKNKTQPHNYSPVAKTKKAMTWHE